MSRAGVGERFPRAARVRRRPDYLAIQNRGRRLAGSNFLLFALPGGGRIGITVSKKVGGAVLRNRVKRWIRDCYRRRRPEFPPGFDLVVVARPPAARADHAAVCGELTSLARRLIGAPAKDTSSRGTPPRGTPPKDAP